MPRKRNRTTEKAQWSLDILEQAIKRITDDKISLHKAAKEFGIPYSTLQKRYNRKDCQQPKPRLGRKPVFSQDQERALADHLIKMSNLFYGLDSTKFRQIAYECAEKLGIANDFNKQRKSAGRDWLEGFLKRNPQISIRKPEATSINRIQGFNKEEVDLFFKNLEDVMEKNGYGPQQIFNMDETGVSTVQDPGKILAQTGQKRVGTITSWERGKTVTAVCSMSAAGVYVPPMFIYPRQRHSPLLEKDGPPGAIYACSKNGWTNEGLYLKWLEHFKKYVTPSENNKILLILDNHNSHSTLEAYEFCKKNHITMLSIPPHSSHRLQPLDVTFFGPLKKAYNRECDLYLKSKNLVKITPYDIAGLFQKAYSRVASIDKAINGFRTTGISPMDTSVFTAEDYYVTNDAASNAVVNCEDDQGHNNRNSSPQILSPANQDQITITPDNPRILRDQITPSQENRPNAASPATDPNIEDQNQVNNEEDVQNNTSLPTDLNAILSIVSPQPSCSREVRKRTHKQHSLVITATPNKVVLEERKKKKVMKENKIPNRQQKSKEKKKVVKKSVEKGKKVLFKNDTSSSDDTDSYRNVCDDNSSDYVEEDSNLCMICCESGKSNELWYRCRACGDWTHAQCSGCDSAKDFVCDFCTRR